MTASGDNFEVLDWKIKDVEPSKLTVLNDLVRQKGSML